MNQSKRLLDVDPRLPIDTYNFENSAWPARWIGHPDHTSPRSVVLGFTLAFTLGEARSITIHVTADQRYELMLDGRTIGRGSERGDLRNWFYETWQLHLDAGEHRLSARVWWLGPDDPAPLAQSGVRPEFLLFAEDAHELLSTGIADWKVKKLDGYSFSPPKVTGFSGVGARTHIDGRLYPWGWQHGQGEWHNAVATSRPRHKQLCWEAESRLLRPALLPEMSQTVRRVGVARHVMAMTEFQACERRENGPPVQAAENIADEQAAWNAMLTGTSAITLAPRLRRRVVIDLQNYYCAYSDLIVSGGDGAWMRLLWAESLYQREPKPGGKAGETWIHKGNRDEIEGKSIIAMGGEYVADGGENRHFTQLWWDAGRYIVIDIQTADQPLTIHSLTLRKTGYPLNFTATFEASDPRLAEVMPLALRSLQRCAHETYMDCPYYEQLMYVGDTRLQVLVTYVTTPDDRLPRKAIELFDESRDPDGFTASRHPSTMRQRIPPFSMWWVAMVHDAAHWRNDIGFVHQRINGVRAVCEAFRRQIDSSTGLLHTPPGWNFVDWVQEWPIGVPPDGAHGFKGSINWQAALMFRQAADLESLAGEQSLADRNRAAADTLVTAINNHFRDPATGLYAEDLDRKYFSEHAQSLAVIEGTVLGDPARTQQLRDGLLNADLHRTTIYFSHYLFEALGLLGCPDAILDRLSMWFELRSRGFHTTPETYEPRSDCHAWGAHPIFHFFATLLGIRPAAAGFAKVRIRPQLGRLTWAGGSMPHPRGVIEVKVDAGHGHATLPDGIDGELILGDRVLPLRGGTNRW